MLSEPANYPSFDMHENAPRLYKKYLHSIPEVIKGTERTAKKPVPEEIRIMFSTPIKNVVISETDLGAALAYLRAQPCRETLPVNWDRQRLLNQLSEAIGRHPRLGECHAVAPGVFAIVKPAGTDLVHSYEPDGRLQVWLLIRPCGTDPTRLVSL